MTISSTRKALITGGLAVGAMLGSAGVVSALTKSSDAPAPAVTDTNTPTDSGTATDPGTETDTDTGTDAGTGTGVDQSNNDPTHEAGESAEQQAAETAGRGPGRHVGHHGHSNTDPAHEAAESPERAAQEAAEDAAAGTDSSSNTTTGG